MTANSMNNSINRLFEGNPRSLVRWGLPLPPTSPEVSAAVS